MAETVNTDAIPRAPADGEKALLIVVSVDDGSSPSLMIRLDEHDLRKLPPVSPVLSAAKVASIVANPDSPVRISDSKLNPTQRARYRANQVLDLLQLRTVTVHGDVVSEIGGDPSKLHLSAYFGFGHPEIVREVRVAADDTELLMRCKCQSLPFMLSTDKHDTGPTPSTRLAAPDVATVASVGVPEMSA